MALPVAVGRFHTVELAQVDQFEKIVCLASSQDVLAQGGLEGRLD